MARPHSVEALFRELRAQAGSPEEHQQKILLATSSWVNVDEETAVPPRLPRKAHAQYLLEWLLERLLKTGSSSSRATEATTTTKGKGKGKEP